MSYDYRARAYKWAGPGVEKHVDAVAKSLHYNESLHMHDLSDPNDDTGACAYCWLRAGRAVHALMKSGLIAAPQTAEATS